MISAIQALHGVVDGYFLAYRETLSCTYCSSQNLQSLLQTFRWLPDGGIAGHRDGTDWLHSHQRTI
jgi:hypothetical protein